VDLFLHLQQYLVQVQEEAVGVHPVEVEEGVVEEDGKY
jgi:hypothetical protein